MKRSFKDALDFSVFAGKGRAAESLQTESERERESPDYRNGLNPKEASRESPPSIVPTPLSVSLQRGRRRCKKEVGESVGSAEFPSCMQRLMTGGACCCCCGSSGSGGVAEAPPGGCRWSSPRRPAPDEMKGRFNWEVNNDVSTSQREGGFQLPLASYSKALVN